MNILKGFIVGASMLVPGFSGGTMAGQMVGKQRSYSCSSLKDIF